MCQPTFGDRTARPRLSPPPRTSMGSLSLSIRDGLPTVVQSALKYIEYTPGEINNDGMETWSVASAISRFAVISLNDFREWIIALPEESSRIRYIQGLF